MSRKKALPAVSIDPRIEAVRHVWQSRWQEALNLWSPYLRLKNPRFCLSAQEDAREGLTQSFAMIRLDDHTVCISLTKVLENHVEAFPLEILAHEIGHHIYTPGDLNDFGRLLIRIRAGLAGKSAHAPAIANMYEDLFINDRLWREKKLPMEKVFQAFRKNSDSKLWNLYLRIYEILWSLTKGSLCDPAFAVGALEGDAQLANRLIRRYANEWLAGAGRFASLCLPYLIEDDSGTAPVMAWGDTLAAGQGEQLPSGLTEIDPDEAAGVRHPSEDPELSGLDEVAAEAVGDSKRSKPAGTPAPQTGGSGGGGNYREPFAFGQILKAMGLQLSDREIALRYYRERALPHLIPFPKKELPQSIDPLPEGLDIWDIASPLDRINWVETAARSPVIIPGYTTFEQVFGEQPGFSPKSEPIDLDLYVDCSGSMPDPTVNISYLTLAGAIIALSALRVGSRVQATLWSGTNEFSVTEGFVSDEKEVLGILTGYYGGGTAFPLHILRKTYADRKKTDRRVHILVISDEGVDTMFDKDEKGNSGWKLSQMALGNAGGGGTFVLNLYTDWTGNATLVKAHEIGWAIHRVNAWEDLVKFAREFSRKHYG